MELTLSGPMIASYKQEAKNLRDTGRAKSHAQALESVAQGHGAKDWNTLRARAAKPVRLAPGMRVAGRYLGQDFEGRVHAAALLGTDQMRVTLHFDEPVDVVQFDSFSSYRQRVTAVIGADGQSPRTTSDGASHLVITRAEG